MRFVFAVAALTALSAHPAAAQELRRAALEFEVGPMLFADDGIVTETMVGGAGRYYLSPRIAVGPEIVWVDGSNHSHLIITGNLTFDVFGESANGRPRVTPFLVAGGGLYQTREQTGTGPYTSSEGTFTAGGGVRAFLSESLYAAGEARVGWELHLRFDGIVGWRF